MLRLHINCRVIIIITGDNTIITKWGKLSRFVDRAINEWRHLLESVIQQQEGRTEQCF